MSEETKEIDLILDEKKEVNINGKKFLIGKLTGWQILRLFKFLTKLGLKNKKLKELKTDNETNNQDILGFLEILDEQEFAEFVAILLNTDNIEFCKSIDAVDLLETIDILLEKNDINELLKNFSRVGEKLTKQTDKTILN